MEKDQSKNNYSTLKIFSHPDVVYALNEGHMVPPILVHMMWQNLCNHNCEFCSYRREGNKNNNMFSEDDHIPKNKMFEVLDNLKEMGTKAIEITGGGEPSIYPYFMEGVERMVSHGFDIGIVSNGSMLSEDKIVAMAPRLVWARISVDAGRVEDYMRIREVSEKHWERAWRAVSNLRKHGSHPEFALGVGYVVTWDNYKGIKECVRMAKDNGAHNVRISAAFTEKGLGYYSLGKIGNDHNEIIKKAASDASEAKALYEDDGFKVFNLFDERINNMVGSVQDYDYCMAKEVVCVVGGDQKVYTCCSLAFHPNGLIGDISDKSFKDLWFSKQNKDFFRSHDPRKLCRIMCLYEKRNKDFLNNKLKDPLVVIGGKDPVHKNFI